MVTAGCANAAEQSAAARIESVSVRVPTVLLQCARGKHNIDLPECVLMSMRIGCGEVKVHPTDALRDRENDAELDPKVGGMGRRMSGRRIPLRPPLAFRWPCADPRTALLSLRFQWVTVTASLPARGKPNILPAADTAPAAVPAACADIGWASAADPFPHRCRSTCRASTASACLQKPAAHSPEIVWFPCADWSGASPRPASDASSVRPPRHAPRRSTPPAT